jgi:hypothetical protein
LIRTTKGKYEMDRRKENEREKMWKNRVRHP